MFKGKKWDIVIVDVNSNDPESDLWVPTYDFIDVEFLKSCRQCLAEPTGIFVLNMICLREALKQSILTSLYTIWPHIYLNKLEKNRNEVLFCSSSSKSELYLENPYSEKPTDINTDGNTMLLLDEVFNKVKEIKFD